LERALFFVQSGKSYAEIGEFLSTYMPPKLAIIRGLAKENKLEFYKGARSDFAKGLRHISSTYYSYAEDAVKASLGGTAQALRDLACFLRNFHKRFSEEKKRRHLITFGDMEHYALALLWDKSMMRRLSLHAPCRHHTMRFILTNIKIPMRFRIRSSL
jgi:ATP-dependent exoDNAse (exonuclease V) beta subunit